MKSADFIDHIPARFYQKAFAYRDIESECRFLSNVATQISSVEPKKILELAAGPSEHAIWFGKLPGTESHALDISNEMIQLASRIAKEESSNVKFHCQDMVSINIAERDFDLCYCLIASISYITTQDYFLKHLSSVAKILRPGGVYIIETVHPKELLCDQWTTINEWTTDLGIEGQLTLSFGNNEDLVDPITQTRPVRVEVKEEHPEKGVSMFASTVEMKDYLYQELLALVAQSPLSVKKVYGGFDMNINFDNSEKSWRCILALGLD